MSCPVSNLVIGGSKQMADITTPYGGLARNHGVRVVRDMATAVDTRRKTITLASGAAMAYDKLIMSPGIELDFAAVEGLQPAHAAGQVLWADTLT